MSKIKVVNKDRTARIPVKNESKRNLAPAVARDIESISNFLRRESPTKRHNGLEYMPIFEIERQLDNFFGKTHWFWRIDDVKTELTSVIVRGELCVDFSGSYHFVDYMGGVGAVPLQFDAYVIDGHKTRENRYDQQALKPNAHQLAVPSASSFALSNAASRLGKVFGRNLNSRELSESDVRQDVIKQAANQKADIISKLL